ncbi:MAG: hypothetical protein RL562_2409, partial [Planctomycetota bacterium]
MTDKNSSPTPPAGNGGESGSGRGSSARKPKGLGGVLLIMTLLLALFVMISRTGVQTEATVYDFYRHLFSGSIEATSWEDGRVLAQVRSDQDGRLEKIEVALDRATEADGRLIQRLLPFGGRLDARTYQRRVGEFQRQVEEGALGVTQAIFVTEMPARQDPRPGEDPTQPPAPTGSPRSYAVAIVDDGAGDGEKLFRIEAGGDNVANLLTLRQALETRGVPIEDRSISRDRRTLRIERPNTAMLYFLGTIGPWLLILAVVWFFIIRQMRAPGGSGGVLAFGRSRAALYTKENRTNVTFDDVAGIEEAKDELREIIEFLKNPGKFAKLGGNIPRGVLLVGSPG